jgi:aldehyde dehydrogenase (NAD+)
VDKDANIEVSAKRIVWGKYLNAGQTCVAPDYILVHNDVKRELIKYMLKYINEFYYEEGKLKEDFTHIVNERDIKRLLSLTYNQKIICGGNSNMETLEPTILDDVKFDDKIMQEEIFGPIMPLIEFNDLDDIINHLKTLDKPLALYYFGKNKDNQNKVIKNLSFGGGCINDTIMHLTEEKLPFGGVGLSGVGSYHGKKSFETFSHQKSVLKKHEKLEINFKYPPHNDKKVKTIKFLSK